MSQEIVQHDPTPMLDAGRAEVLQTLRQCLQPHASEDEDQARSRLFAALCGIVDAAGAGVVLESLQLLSRTEPLPLITVAADVLRLACLRSEGSAFGRPYDAHMMVVPLVVRGSTPAHFPLQMDRITASLLHDVLRHVLAQCFAEGSQCFALPLSFVYTKAEFASTGLEYMHQVLQIAFQAVRSHSMESAPKFISVNQSIDTARRTDSELHDLKLPGIGMASWFERLHDNEAGGRLLNRLHRGQWITARLVPVVMLVPHGMEPPSFEGFGSDAQAVGQMLAFSSVRDDGSDSETTDIQITPLGLQCVDEGCALANLAIGHERLVSSILRGMQEMDAATVEIDFSFDPQQNLLHVTVADGADSYATRVSLPAGLVAQQFIEKVLADLAHMQLATRVDMGDAMLRPQPLPSLSVH